MENSLYLQIFDEWNNITVREFDYEFMETKNLKFGKIIDTVSIVVIEIKYIFEKIIAEMI